MKLFALFIFLILQIKLFYTYKSNFYTDEGSYTFENSQMESKMEFKLETINLLENLYESSNFKSICEDKNAMNKKTKRLQKRFFINNKNYLPQGKKDEEFYKYYKYNEIIEELNKMAKENSRYLKVETGQKLYNLPNPGGYCSEKKEKCEHYIAFLTDHEVDNTNKHQIYISGEVHGDEQVGPNASLELIKLFLKHKDNNEWIKHLLKTRLVVITPMTNPYGYYKSFRTEKIDKHKFQDINRDFPYLVDKDKCMSTIGARLVNELFINHLFSLALTLHGGTESLTYPYGAPNHLKNSRDDIPLRYTEEGSRLKIETFNNTNQVVNKYRKNLNFMRGGESTEAPDSQALLSIASVASFHCVSEKNKRYRVGDMSKVVYPVTGGMEDWAYAGSWEGSPVITQPCEPKTYGGYDKEKTLYDKNYKDALKSIMFLLEISHTKIPNRESLGKRSNDDECILNLRDNPFNIFNNTNNNNDENINNTNNKEEIRKNCLNSDNDGYVNKVLRLSLTLIDLLNPYIRVNLIQSASNVINVSWVVGGSLFVDETYAIFNFVNTPSNKLTDQQIITKFKNKSKVLKGKAIWDRNFNSTQDLFNINITPNNNLDKKYIEVIVFAKLDKDWLQQINPSPKIKPQTHIVNLRNNNDYIAKNGKFILKGQEYFKSEIYLLEIKK